MLEQDKISIQYDRRYSSTLTLDEAPGAEDTSNNRIYVEPTSSKWIYLDTVSGNDSNSGLTSGLPKLTYSAAAALVDGSTYTAVHVLNTGATLSVDIDKPTQMARGALGSISGDATAPADVFTQAVNSAINSGYIILTICYSPDKNLYVAGAQFNEISYATDADTFTLATTPSFGASNNTINKIIYAEKIGLFIAGGGGATVGKIAYSSDGNTWVQVTLPGAVAEIVSLAYNPNSGIICAVSTKNNRPLILYSYDGISWGASSDFTANTEWPSYTPRKIIYAEYLSKFVLVLDRGNYLGMSSDGISWALQTTTGMAVAGLCIAASNSMLVIGGTSDLFYYSTNGTSWTQATQPTGFTGKTIRDIVYWEDVDKFVAVGSSGGVGYSSDGNIWTLSATPSFSTSQVYSIALGDNKVVACGQSAKIARSDSYSITISANVAGFTINRAAFSSTISLYSCTIKNYDFSSTSAAVILTKCKTERVMINGNTALVNKCLIKGNIYIKGTPATANSTSIYSNTISGSLIINNSSVTGYEFIADNIIENGISASYNVTVSSGNTRGTNSNVIFGSKCTFDDPNFVDTTDYKLQFRGNGYTANSIAVAASTFYLNSAGARRDIGAWSYVESAISYYYNKSAPIDKGDITIAKEMVVSTQQGDTGEVSVYTNRNRIREVLTYTYNFVDTTTIDILNFIENECDDLTVKICDDPDYYTNSGTVTANGNHSIGDVVLNIDSQATFSGMTVTIGSIVYYVLYALPSQSATTKLVLNKALLSAISDNDILVTNYPSGVGEYQYQPQQRLVLKRPEKSSLKTWREGLTITFTRKWQ